jgi:hypothetical protein
MWLGDLQTLMASPIFDLRTIHEKAPSIDGAFLPKVHSVAMKRRPQFSHQIVLEGIEEESKG